MRVFLLRHGEAQPDEDVPRDEDRALTEKGETRLHKACRGLRRLEVFPERIFTSPVTRALQTARIIAEELGFVEDIEAVEELAPDAEPEDMAEVLKSLRHDQVMLVGHQPHLGQLAALLITGETRGRVGIKKGGLVRIDVDDWREDPPGQIRWLLTVKQLSWMKKKQKKAGDDAGGSEE
ncbi:MAG TPA: phosphohistidine phosphatase SixA [Planctomycetota bacterium]|nr:phosphohistidine phosphatase SixA [Planctomycetota bacterium]